MCCKHLNWRDQSTGSRMLLLLIRPLLLKHGDRLLLPEAWWSITLTCSSLASCSNNYMWIVISGHMTGSVTWSGVSHDRFGCWQRWITNVHVSMYVYYVFFYNFNIFLSFSSIFNQVLNVYLFRYTIGFAISILGVLDDSLWTICISK